MTEEKQDGSASEVISKGADAARAIQGAVKTGKAIAGLAKGAALGGPYGAAAMAVWQNRKTVIIIALAVTFIMLLPILFILMLPSLIFGGLKSADSPEIPIMNDNAAIYANIEDVNAKVREILSSAHEMVLITVQGLISGLSDGDEHEIIDRFDLDAALDTNTLISQYCAHKENYGDIDTGDLISTVNRHKDKLFSYAVTVDTRTATLRREIDGVTREETVTINRYIYTVSFAGADYFAGEVFKMDEEQAELARSYAENLSMFLGAGYGGGGNEILHFTGEGFAPVIVNWKSRVSSEFGYRIHPVYRDRRFHAGIDISGPTGTPIYAAADGTVLYASFITTGYGYHLDIDHGGGTITRYAHCSKIFVSGGQAVQRGEKIAEVGSTGLSTGPHLHFEVRVNGVPKDPRAYLPYEMEPFHLFQQPFTHQQLHKPQHRAVENEGHHHKEDGRIFQQPEDAAGSASKRETGFGPDF
jgi:murein DD-endopeptidase MepM/ murein hydrolase activator NlpD